jgi:hypothetical protein
MWWYTYLFLPLFDISRQEDHDVVSNQTYPLFELAFHIHRVGTVLMHADEANMMRLIRAFHDYAKAVKEDT